MDCAGCGWFLASPSPQQGNLCSQCFKKAAAGASTAPVSAPCAPLCGGVLSVRTLHQMGAAAREAAAAHGLRTMLCGWFCAATASLLARRFAGSEGPPRLTRADFAALCADLADPALVLPPLDAAMAVILFFLYIAYETARCHRYSGFMGLRQGVVS